MGFVNQLHVDIPLVPWLSALQVIGLDRRNINRRLVLATHIISVKHVSHTLNSETIPVCEFDLKSVNCFKAFFGPIWMVEVDQSRRKRYQFSLT